MKQMTSIKEQTTQLNLDAEGIWKSSETQGLSCSDGGNAHYFQFEDTPYWFQHRNQILCSLVKRSPPTGAIEGRRQGLTHVICSTVEAVEFHIEYSSFFFNFLTEPVFLLRLIPSRLGLRLQSKMQIIQKEHPSLSGMGGWWLHRARTMELLHGSQGKTMGWGSNCLIVARTSY